MFTRKAAALAKILSAPYSRQILSIIRVDHTHFWSLLWIDKARAKEKNSCIPRLKGAIMRPDLNKRIEPNTKDLNPENPCESRKKLFLAKVFSFNLFLEIFSRTFGHRTIEQRIGIVQVKVEGRPHALGQGWSEDHEHWIYF